MHESELMCEIETYADIISGHPHFNTSYKKLRKVIQHAIDGNLIFVYGPTGVGKSTLLRHLILEILKEESYITAADNSCLPIVRIEVEYPSSKKFSWIEFYRYALKSLQEPLIDKKLKNVSSRLKLDLLTKNLHVNGAASHELKAAFFQALSMRKCKILLLDEAHHFAKGYEGKSLKSQLEYLKSIANKEGKIIVMVGTYDLLDFLNLSGQTGRRGRSVHFPRYLATEKEMTRFIKIVKAFEKISPLSWEVEIMDDIPYLYTYSAGCVGILKEWIVRAHKEAVDNEATKLSLEHLRNTEISLDTLKVITNELIAGEMRLIPSKDDLQLIQAQLGIGVTTTPTSNSEMNETAKSTDKPKPKRRQVGIRKAKRDPIGVGHG